MGRRSGTFGNRCHSVPRQLGAVKGNSRLHWNHNVIRPGLSDGVWKSTCGRRNSLYPKPYKTPIIHSKTYIRTLPTRIVFTTQPVRSRHEILSYF
jgi:hypothetical protein